MLFSQIMPMDTTLLRLWLNRRKLLRLRWCCQITLRVQRWTSRGFAWYTIYPPPSAPIFTRVPSLEHMLFQKSTAPIWRRWVSSLVRSLTWNGQLAVGYHTWTKNIISITSTHSFGLCTLFLHIHWYYLLFLSLARNNLHVKNNQ